MYYVLLQVGMVVCSDNSTSVYPFESSSPSLIRQLTNLPQSDSSLVYNQNSHCIEGIQSLFSIGGPGGHISYSSLDFGREQYLERYICIRRCN